MQHSKSEKNYKEIIGGISAEFLGAVIEGMIAKNPEECHLEFTKKNQEGYLVTAMITGISVKSH